MKSYISILRGINVSGHNLIRMQDLKKMFEDLGMAEVLTYIQSGNVVFKGSKPAATVTSKIETAIRERFGFVVPVITRDAWEWQDTMAGNPFLSEPDIDHDKLHVTFLEEIPDKGKSNLIPLSDNSPDRYIMKDKNIYLYCPGGYGNTKWSNSFFERKLKVKATTRNWKTVIKLAELAGIKASP
ncbi:MAG: DUF1697 domain-containing protein [Alphaproteobacteria bacterium]|nr:DUF1697 domain-containing protein [Alphaproteobacteria bacterium]